MNDQQEHLKTALIQRKQIILELQELNTQVEFKKETLLKLLGIIEYLTEIGVKLPEENNIVESTTTNQEEEIEE